mgnify:FL=1
MGRILLQPIFCWKEETSRMRFWKQRINWKKRQMKKQMKTEVITMAMVRWIMKVISRYQVKQQRMEQRKMNKRYRQSRRIFPMMGKQ